MQADYDDGSDVAACLDRSIQRRPEHCAVAFGTHRLSFAELGAAVSLCIDSLRTSNPSARLVGLHLGRTPEYLIAYLALAALGVLAVPFDEDARDEEIAAEARALGVSAIVTNRELCGTGHLPLIRVKATDPSGGPIPWVASVPFAGRLPRIAQLCADTPLVLLKTSGSTSRPKRVLLQHGNALASSRAHRASTGHGPGEVSLVGLPMSFGYCHATQLIAQVDAGGTLALLPGTFTPRTFGEAVAAVGATTTTVVPSMLALLARSPRHTGAKLRSLRTIVFGGAPVKPEILDALHVRLPQAELIQTYGQTEAGPRITTLRWADAETRRGSVGRAVPGMRIVIRSPSGESLPSGQIGEIVVSGGGVMSGYFNDPAATTSLLRDGWLRTGDLGSLDEDGFLWLAGRLRNLIITAGRNVVAEEVEAHLRQVPGVADAAVFGEPDELRGEAIHALIVARAGVVLAERDVRASLATRLDRHKIPRRVSIVSDLPRTANGKIDRALLGFVAAKETV
jgi:long-chain acyl-CoA synthetase